VSAFGFPVQGRTGGHHGRAVAGELVPAGAPVYDETVGAVIGMVTEIVAPDGSPPLARSLR
jgi:hypothetical protein